MANYTPPNISNLSFKFTTGGYQKPNFGNVPFNFGLRPSYSDTANLQASIDVMKLYQDSTYTYLKECRTIVVGYGANGIQTLKLPCSYGGIRDIGSYIYGHPESLDLLATIFSFSNSLDLKTFSRATIRDNIDLSTWHRPNFRDTLSLTSYIKGWFTDTLDLIGFIRPTIQEIKNLSSLCRPTITETSDLSHWYRVSYRETLDLSGGLIKILQTPDQTDLLSYLETIQPLDLQSFLNVIEIKNLPSYINGVWLQDNKDLSAEFFHVFFRQSKPLSASIFGWEMFDLMGNIIAFWKKDLSANINAGFFEVYKDLPSSLNIVSPVYLGANIHGYDTKNLLASISSLLFGPTDLQATIYSIRPLDLASIISGYKGIQQSNNLSAYITGFYLQDLPAYINSISAKNLYAYITSTGNYKNLIATIVPKTINIKRIITIPLMEHKDLAAVINYSCLFSSYKDLSAYVYLIRKKDLKGTIIGWYGNGSADRVVDLGARINYSDYRVTDTIDISGSPRPIYSEIHRVYGGKDKNYKVLDTYTVLGGGAIKTLQAAINGVLTTRDLNAIIEVQSLSNFTTVPSWVSPKYREVFININRFEERWKRFVELMFETAGDKDFHYFYVSGNNTAYKINRNRTWSVLVTGYDTTADDIIDRVNVRKKIIFNLSNYSNIDEAVRDVMDRVVEYRKLDLTANIYPTLSPHSNLGAAIAVKFKGTWQSHLQATVTVAP